MICKNYGQQCQGVDLNRNWPVDYGARGGQSVGNNACAEDHPGQNYFSEPETLAICELVANVTNQSGDRLCDKNSPHPAVMTGAGDSIAAAIDFHAFGQLVLGSWAHTNQPAADSIRMSSIGNMMVEALLPESYIYGTGDAGGSSYLASGVLPDWLNYAFKSAAYTLELPPRTWELGGFHLSEDDILKACLHSYKAFLAMLEGLSTEVASAEDVETMELLSDAMPAPADNKNYCGLFNATLEVNIQPDLYPIDIGWELFHSNGDVFVRWVKSRYGSTNSSNGLTGLGGRIEICKPDVYLFVVRDSFGDGICCSHGHGGFSLSINGNVIHTQDGNYQLQATVALKIDDSPLGQRLLATDQDAGVSQVIQGLQQQLHPTLGMLDAMLEADPIETGNPASHLPVERQTDTPAPSSSTPIPSTVPDPTSRLPIPDTTPLPPLAGSTAQKPPPTPSPTFLSILSSSIEPISRHPGVEDIATVPRRTTTVIGIAAGVGCFVLICTLAACGLWHWQRGSHASAQLSCICSFDDDDKLMPRTELDGIIRISRAKKSSRMALVSGGSSVFRIWQSLASIKLTFGCPTEKDGPLDGTYALGATLVACDDQGLSRTTSSASSASGKMATVTTQSGSHAKQTSPIAAWEVSSADPRTGDQTRTTHTDGTQQANWSMQPPTYDMVRFIGSTMPEDSI
mmetsp:Transcript_16191/g.45135  ORF Transcript_16191/g.45135 Transcript_16191/m.45135 type:complete len:684 (+) Transcript_16191:3-2054(+)